MTILIFAKSITPEEWLIYRIKKLGKKSLCLASSKKLYGPNIVSRQSQNVLELIRRLSVMFCAHCIYNTKTPWLMRTVTIIAKV